MIGRGVRGATVKGANEFALFELFGGHCATWNDEETVAEKRGRCGEEGRSWARNGS
jgi:hypothetical protein